MTTLHLVLIGVCAVGWLAAAVLAWALCAAAKRRTPEPDPPGAYRRGMCQTCGELDVVLRADGQPHRRFHHCDPAAVQAHVWPPAPADGVTP